jgi:uncharacterized damage-inducible protein DinB
MDSVQAKFLMEQLTGLWESEYKATCEVLAAVPATHHDYKPDPKSRSAWELAVHLATADVWFLESVIAGAFPWDADTDKKNLARFKTVDEVVAFYKKEWPAKLAAVRALSGEKLAEPVDFFGLMKMPGVSYIGFGNNHSVHHRGQLASGLRAMGSKVPAIYGASADTPMGS